MAPTTIHPKMNPRMTQTSAFCFADWYWPDATRSCIAPTSMKNARLTTAPARTNTPNHPKPKPNSQITTPNRNPMISKIAMMIATIFAAVNSSAMDWASGG